MAVIVCFHGSLIVYGMHSLQIDMLNRFSLSAQKDKSKLRELVTIIDNKYLLLGWKGLMAILRWINDLQSLLL